jgi:hypothetical protein
MLAIDLFCRWMPLWTLVLFGLLGSAASSQAQLGDIRALRADPKFSQGIQWLADRQQPEGHWKDEGPARNDVGATGLALLPFLGSGQTHKSEKNAVYRENVERGLKFLIRKQGAQGSFDLSVRAHALATLGLCEAYGVTADPVLKGPAQRALDHLAALQLPDGGWNEKQATAGDAMITCWAMQALKSGQMAGLSVAKETWMRYLQFAEAMQVDERGSIYRRSKGGNAEPTATAALLLCQQYVGRGPRNPGMQKGVEYLMANPPGKEPKDLQYLHLTTHVLNNLGGDAGAKWESKVPGLLKDSVMGEGENRGSWSGTEGRVVSTSLALLTLEINYRFLPLHRGMYRRPNLP